MAAGLSDAQILEKLARLERNVARIAKHVGVELEDPSRGIDPDIVALARSGDRIGAAKVFAERTGSNFVDAQRAVNDL